MKISSDNNKLMRLYLLCNVCDCLYIHIGNEKDLSLWNDKCQHGVYKLSFYFLMFKDNSNHRKLSQILFILFPIYWINSGELKTIESFSVQQEIDL